MGIKNVKFNKQMLNGFNDDKIEVKRGVQKITTQQVKRQYNKIPKGTGDPNIIEERNLICPHCGSKHSIVYSTNNFKPLNFKKCYRRCKKCKQNFVSTQFFKSK